ncbi:DUF2242 domain-containing protein, partial [Variovorax sp. dw_954]|uniref:DUF2242 domain-containing protein n=2 Tax=unclassified Variovorax TaxID=663243 RepID=UPI001BD1CC39
MTSKCSRPVESVSSARWWAIGAALAALALAGCTTFSARRISYDTEEFDSTTTHTRTFAATSAQTCEAARRALLSQGYLITGANADLVTGRKNFQPANEVHLEVEVRVVCAREAQPAKGKARRESTLAFVSALQDRYSLKKTNNSASVGVGVLGSLSVPISASDDAMVKVASETVTDARFYDRFFVLLDQYLAADVETQADDPPPVAAAAGPAAPTTAGATGAAAAAA